jgi:hypothetical protein
MVKGKYLKLAKYTKEIEAKKGQITIDITEYKEEEADLPSNKKEKASG